MGARRLGTKDLAGTAPNKPSQVNAQKATEINIKREEGKIGK